MPAISEAQQNFFKLVNAYKKGGLKKSEVSKEVVSAAKEMTKKEIADYLTLKKRNMHDINAEDDTLEDIDPSYTVYEDITMEDILKFKAILDMLDISPNAEGHLVVNRRGKYMRI
jgi:transcription elongation GreA/GreB family factor